MSRPLPSVRLDFERHRLDNGLEVVLHHDPSLPLVAVNLWYHVGSKNEVPGRTGFAHLFEHLLFQGSQNVDTNGHFRWIQLAGGVANGSTWYDRTNYFETVPSHFLDLALWLESDRMGFFLPAVTQEKLDNQREVVINERRQRIDNQPYGRAFERLYETLYPADHPYHWPVIGYVEDLENATLDDVRAFFSTYYLPNNAVLTLAGDFDAGALDRIARWFGEIPAGAPVTQPRAPTPPAAAHREELPDRVQLTRHYMAFHLPRFGDPAWYAADLLATALTGGKSSPMYEDLVYERQLAQEVGCYALPTEATAVFVVVATARPGIEAEVLEEALRDHLRRAAEPLDEVEIERARRRVLTGYFSQLQNLERRADLLSQFTTLFDDPGRLAAEPEIYQRLTAEDLAEAARTWLRTEDRHLITVVPESTATSVGLSEASTVSGDTPAETAAAAVSEER